jgi:hypothetical protein
MKEYKEMTAYDIQTGKIWTEYWEIRQKKHWFIKVFCWLIYPKISK